MKPPKLLYRAFSSKRYAEDFFYEGKFRLGLLEYYIDIEDENIKDESEGRSSSYVNSLIPNVTMNKETGEITKTKYKPGLLNVVGSHINPLYLFCASSEHIEFHILKKFGNHIVRINDPIALLNDIDMARPKNSRMEKVGRCTIEQVLYTKGQIEDFDPDSIEAVKRCYIQKPPTFKEECEFRFVVTTIPMVNAELDKFLLYELCRSLDYTEILE